MSNGFRCALTGHRALKDFDRGEMEAAIDELIGKGYTTFYCGMAKGFDLEALSYLMKKKETTHVRLEAFVPYPGQEKDFSEREQKRYRELLSKCDEVHFTSKQFYRYVENVRDKQMDEKADAVLAFLRRETGGTAFTVKHAKSLGIEVIFV